MTAMRPNQMRSTALLLQILLAVIYLSFYSVNGYIVGRLLSLQNPSSEGGLGEMEDSSNTQTYLVARRSSDTSQFTPSSQETRPLSGDLSALIPTAYPSKKSNYMGYKSLKKFNGNGSRNCFFTPVQCMIEHDMSKYKKLVDSNIRIGGVARR